MIVEQGITSGGVRYIIRDDCAAPRESEEGRRRAEEQCRIASEIMRAAQERETA